METVMSVSPRDGGLAPPRGRGKRPVRPRPPSSQECARRDRKTGSRDDRRSSDHRAGARPSRGPPDPPEGGIRSRVKGDKCTEWLRVANTLRMCVGRSDRSAQRDSRFTPGRFRRPHLPRRSSRRPGPACGDSSGASPARARGPGRAARAAARRTPPSRSRQAAGPTTPPRASTRASSDADLARK
jgi:hypothetical protein